MKNLLFLIGFFYLGIFHSGCSLQKQFPILHPLQKTSLTSFPLNSSSSSSQYFLPMEKVTLSQPLKRKRKNIQGKQDLKKGNILFHLHQYRGLQIFLLHHRKILKIAERALVGQNVEMFLWKQYLGILLNDVSELKKTHHLWKKERSARLLIVNIATPNKAKIIGSLKVEGKILKGKSFLRGHFLHILSQLKPQRGKYFLQITTFSLKQRITMIAKMPILLGKSYYTKRLKRHHIREAFLRKSIISTRGRKLLIATHWRRYDKYWNKSSWKKRRYYYRGRYYFRNIRYRCFRDETSYTTKVTLLTWLSQRKKWQFISSFKMSGLLLDAQKQIYYRKGLHHGYYLAILQDKRWLRDRCHGNYQHLMTNKLISVELLAHHYPRILSKLPLGKKNSLLGATRFDLDKKIIYQSFKFMTPSLIAIDFHHPKKLKITDLIERKLGSIKNIYSLKQTQHLLLVAYGHRNFCRRQIALYLIKKERYLKYKARLCLSIPHATNIYFSHEEPLLKIHHGRKRTFLTLLLHYTKRQYEGKRWRFRRLSGLAIVTLKNSNLHRQGIYGEREEPIKRSLWSSPTNIFLFSHHHLDWISSKNKKLKKSLKLFNLVQRVFRFGKYLIEQVRINGTPARRREEFRASYLGKNTSPRRKNVVILRTQWIKRAIRWKNILILFSNPLKITERGSKIIRHWNYSSTIIRSYDMTHPLHPRKLSQLNISYNLNPNTSFLGHYPSHKNVSLSFHYRISQNLSTFMRIKDGFVAFVRARKKIKGTNIYAQIHKLFFLNLQNPKKLTYHTINLPVGHFKGFLYHSPRRFYLVTAKNYASYSMLQRWDFLRGKWQAGQWQLFYDLPLRIFSIKGKSTFLSYSYLKRSLVLLQLEHDEEVNILAKLHNYYLRYYNNITGIAYRKGFLYCLLRIGSYPTLLIYDLRKGQFKQIYRAAFQLSYLRLRGIYKNLLLLQGDRMLLWFNIEDPSHPQKVLFQEIKPNSLHSYTRPLWIEIYQNHALMAAGWQGFLRMPLR